MSVTDLDNECICTSEMTGKDVMFCYTDPQNSTSIGTKFNCSYVQFLENWGLLDDSDNYVDTTKQFRSENDVVFLSACSDDHYEQTKASLKSIRKFYPTQKYILYSLRLNEKNRAMLEKKHNVEIRDFDFSKYPSYITQWLQYRWKPLIIAEVLKQYSNIWWMDAHVAVVGGNFTNITYKERADGKVESDIIIPTYASHSNYAVLDQDLLKFLPSNSMSLLKKETQLGANLFYVAKTKQSIELFKWWTLCALEETCMSPPNSKLLCNFTQDRYNDYADCFRYDQSVINLLLLNKFQNQGRYSSSVGNQFGRL